MIEKEMVNDALNNMISGLTSYASMISQTENQELRNTLKQMRDQAEKSQYDLYTIAKNLNYYVPAQQASQDEISKVKQEVFGGCCCSSKGSSGSNASKNQIKNSTQNSSTSSQSSNMSQNSSSMNQASNSVKSSCGCGSSAKSHSLPDDIDEEKLKALQAPPKTEQNSYR